MKYHTQMEAAKKGIITKEMEIVAKKEYMEVEKLRALVAKGEVAIPCNIYHKSLSREELVRVLKPRSMSIWGYQEIAKTMK